MKQHTIYQRKSTKKIGLRSAHLTIIILLTIILPFNNNNTPPGAGHRVVVEGLSSQSVRPLRGLAGEARSRPGVTVAGGPRGPIGYGRGPRALYRAILVKIITCLGRVAYVSMAVSPTLPSRCSCWAAARSEAHAIPRGHERREPAGRGTSSTRGWRGSGTVGLRLQDDMELALAVRRRWWWRRPGRGRVRVDSVRDGVLLVPLCSGRLPVIMQRQVLQSCTESV